MDNSERNNYIKQAYDEGRRAGEAAGSWAANGNTDPEHARKVVEMMNNGDPKADDFLPPMPNLSGEWADSETPNSLFANIVGRAAETAEDTELMDELSEAWEYGVSETFHHECEYTLRSVYE